MSVRQYTDLVTTDAPREGGTSTLLYEIFALDLTSIFTSRSCSEGTTVDGGRGDRRRDGDDQGGRVRCGRRRARRRAAAGDGHEAASRLRRTGHGRGVERGGALRAVGPLAAGRAGRSDRAHRPGRRLLAGGRGAPPTGPARVARAVVEGLSYVVRDCLEACRVRPVELRVCGGGANSAEWCQL
ncbi:MAG: hypothetical protein GEV09_25470, partial [Pseudonocardiaceae bacterium]|nr:hypothetical protein [Pseudonocardiaceae bacterium]